MKREKYTTSLDPEVLQQLRQQYVDEKRAANEIIEDALRDYFKTHKQKDTR